MKKYILAFALIASVFVATANAESLFKFDKDLSVGATGTEVIQLQSWLIDNGFDIPAISNNQTNKGFFGSQTKKAVAKYQESVGIPNTGYFGPLTRTKLNNVDVSGSAFNIISPRGNENWQTGSNQTIRWNAPPFIRATYVDINLIPYNAKFECPLGYVCQPSAEFLVKLNRPITNVVKNISIDNKSYVWNIPTTGLFGDYIIQICQTGTSVCAESKSPFSISDASPTPLQLTVVSPNGGENWVNGTTRTISWKLANGMDQNTKVDIYLAKNLPMACNADGTVCGSNPVWIALTNLDKNISSNAPYNWIVGTDMVNNPIVPGTYKVQICITGSTTCDVSDSLFTLVK